MSESITSPPPTLSGRVAIVTGASRGIGRAIALHLASLGASLVINYASNATQADDLATQINSQTTASPPRATSFRANISNPAEVKALFDHAQHTFGAIHILVNCAGVLDPHYPTISETSEQVWDNTFEVNTKGAFLCCREAATRVVRGGSGRIITMSSSMVGGLRPGYGAYAASKAATETLTRILAKELKGTGITANAVAPGPIATEMFFAGKSEEAVQRLIDECPLSRLGETKDVVAVVGFLAGDSGEWVNGQVIRVNGGYV